ncbi:MAG: hypothetical protein HOP33_12570 [Verrucomicrobia bacterium]|nr:hypothetical protein [Verrucomicrobiota bacterium]
MISSGKKLKRFIVVLALLFGFAGILFIATSKSASDRNAPRLVLGQPADAITNLARMAMYSWAEDMPFQEGRAWIWSTTNRTNSHTYLVDMDSTTVVGELLNAGAIFYNNDQTKLLCSGHDSLLPTMKYRLAKWLDQAFGWKISSRLNTDETHWILDLRNNHAKPIGQFSQLAGMGSMWHPSPGFRFGYNIPSTIGEGREFYLCDLELEQMTLIRYNASVQTWWDEQHLLMKDHKQNFFLYDVLTRQSNQLFSAAQLNQFLKESNLPESLEHLNVVHRWTREGSTLYLSSRTNELNCLACLLKVDTSASLPKLEIFRRDFQFEWLGRLNSEGVLYVYSGESGKSGDGGDGSVHIRDLRTDEVRTLIESDHSNQYTLPRFYKNRVIYMKSRQLWSVDVNGSNNFKLFELPKTAGESPK